jgi:hypothetical protein
MGRRLTRKSADKNIFLWNTKYFRIISHLVEKKGRILSEKGVFSMGSTNRRFPLRHRGPMPGQKSIRLSKKGGGPSLPKADFCALLSSRSFPPRLFAETKKD